MKKRRDGESSFTVTPNTTSFKETMSTGILVSDPPQSMSGEAFSVPISDGIDIQCVLLDGELWGVLPYLCGRLGIDSTAQRRRLKKQPWGRVAKLATRRSDGQNADQWLVHKDTIPMWLATIQVASVREERRSVLSVYQQDAAAALARFAYGETGQQGACEIGREVARGIRDGLREGLAPLEIRVDVLEHKVDAGLSDIRDELRRIKPRKPPKSSDQRRHFEVIASQWFNGYCPCCLETLILNEGEWTDRQRWEHFYANHKNGINETWPTCHDCNVRLEDTLFRREKQTAFDHFHKIREQLEHPLILGRGLTA